MKTIEETLRCCEACFLFCCLTKNPCFPNDRSLTNPLYQPHQSTYDPKPYISQLSKLRSSQQSDKTVTLSRSLEQRAIHSRAQVVNEEISARPHDDETRHLDRPEMARAGLAANLETHEACID
jgi:hypothetical protein